MAIVCPTSISPLDWELPGGQAVTSLGLHHGLRGLVFSRVFMSHEQMSEECHPIQIGPRYVLSPGGACWLAWGRELWVHASRHYYPVTGLLSESPALSRWVQANSSLHFLQDPKSCAFPGLACGCSGTPRRIKPGRCRVYQPLWKLAEGSPCHSETLLSLSSPLQESHPVLLLDVEPQAEILRSLFSR